MRSTFQIYLKSRRTDFEPLPGVQRVATLWCTFGLLFRTSEKVTLKPFLLETFREKNGFPKSLFPGFSGKAKTARWFDDSNHRAAKYEFFCPTFLKRKAGEVKGEQPLEILCVCYFFAIHKYGFDMEIPVCKKQIGAFADI